MNDRGFLVEHAALTRRYFLRLGSLGVTALAAAPQKLAAEDPKTPTPAPAAPTTPKADLPKAEQKEGAARDPYFTPADDFRDVSRGKPLPHSLPDDKKREVGLTRDTWKLEIVSDSEYPARLGKTFTKAADTALDFKGLLALGEKHAVRFAKVMTCLNIGCPLGMGLWEGVPLRDVIWLTDPRENVRRVSYYGYHNDDPAQMFRSSLPIGRVLEDYGDLPPVILCYKLNGQWLDSERGGPVRVVVPEHYGYKSIKWLSHLVLTNLPHANDTYAAQGNDVDSPMKTFAATLNAPREVKPEQSVAVSGYAQVGISGLKKVQVSIRPAGHSSSPDDDDAWRDAELLPAPNDWKSLPDGRVPGGTFGFDDAGRPMSWPMRLAKIHWAIVWPGLPAGDYVLQSRSVDSQGYAQPLPRPFRKSGHAALETIALQVKA